MVIPREGAMDARAGACGHAAAEYLGRDHSVTFYRYRACGAILIDERGRLWRLRPAPAV